MNAPGSVLEFQTRAAWVAKAAEHGAKVTFFGTASRGFAHIDGVRFGEWDGAASYGTLNLEVLA